MNPFKTEEEKVTYVETLTALVSIGENINESHKILIYNILRNYDLPETYADRVWKKVRSKVKLEEIMMPIKAMDMDVRLLLVQELIMMHLASGTYQQAKDKLINVCRELEVPVKLEALKEHVQNVLKSNNKL